MNLITVQMAARELGISTKRVSLLCSKGRIKAKRLGARLYLIDPHSLAEYKQNKARALYTPETFSPGRPKKK